MSQLVDTNASQIAAEFVRERRRAGSPTMGMVMTLVIVMTEEDAEESLRAARLASHEHPGRVLAVIIGSGRGRGRIVAQGTPEDLVASTGTLVRAVELDQLTAALTGEGLAHTVVADGLRVDAEPLQVGKVAAAHQVALIELRPADGAGLEDLFLELTADTQRESFTEGVQA